MAKLSTDDLLDAFKEMTLLELSEFVKQFEDTFDVKAAAPVAAVAAPGAGGAGAAAEAPEEKDEFNITLEAAGDKKIQVIKEVRTLTSLGLKEAKDLVDGAPKVVLENVAVSGGEFRPRLWAGTRVSSPGLGPGRQGSSPGLGPEGRSSSPGKKVFAVWNVYRHGLVVLVDWKPRPGFPAAARSPHRRGDEPGPDRRIMPSPA
jgi:large subunit ribosomal protein L7/L12